MGPAPCNAKVLGIRKQKKFTLLHLDNDLPYCTNQTKVTLPLPHSHVQKCWSQPKISNNSRIKWLRTQLLDLLFDMASDSKPITFEQNPTKDGCAKWILVSYVKMVRQLFWGESFYWFLAKQTLTCLGRKCTNGVVPNWELVIHGRMMESLIKPRRMTTLSVHL